MNILNATSNGLYHTFKQLCHSRGLSLCNLNSTDKKVSKINISFKSRSSVGWDEITINIIKVSLHVNC